MQCDKILDIRFSPGDINIYISSDIGISIFLHFNYIVFIPQKYIITVTRILKERVTWLMYYSHNISVFVF